MFSSRPSDHRRSLRLYRSPEVRAIAIVWAVMVLAVGAAIASERWLAARGAAHGVAPDGYAPLHASEVRAEPATFISALNRPSIRPNCLPLSSVCDEVEMTIQGRDPGPEGESLPVAVNVVDARLFTALELPLIFGRSFTEADRIASVPVAVINDAAARRFWPDEVPIGQRIRLSLSGQGCGWIEVVGVISDVSFGELEVDVAPTVYLARPFAAAENAFVV